MTPDELLSLVTLVGVNARRRGDEVVLETCPYCGNDRWNMEINAINGLAKCWACKEPRPGRADTVVTLLTGEHHHLTIHREGGVARGVPVVPDAFATVPIERSPVAARYLARRGITPDVIARFRLAVCAQRGHLLDGRIVIPALDFWTTVLVGWVGRTFTNHRPKYLSTLGEARVTGWRAPGRTTPCVVVEGHLDGIAVHRAEYSAAVLGGIAAPDLEEWLGRVDERTPVVIMLDGSATSAAAQLYWRAAVVRGSGRLCVAALAEDQDPASVGPDGVRAAVSAALGT
jgi:hypothetical protein